jgi:MerR family transcriptional regulator, light-induced transcriptional regulator
VPDADSAARHAGPRAAVLVGVAAAAEQVGVAASTLRAWERRYGVRPSGRTAGGHRRYTADDVIELQRMHALIESGMSTASAAALNASTVRRGVALPGPVLIGRADAAAARFADAVHALAPAGVSRAATELVGALGAAAAWNEVFAPYLQSVGRRWAHTGEGVDEEHVAVAALQAILRRQAMRHAGRARPAQVLAAAVPNERHVLPLDALAAALAEQGISSCVLYDLPSSALHSAVARRPDAVVVLWSRGSAHLPLLRGLASQAPAACAAGPGWRRTRLPVTVSRLTTLSAALEVLHAFTAQGAAAPPGH